MYAKIKGYFEEFLVYFPEYKENSEYITLLRICDAPGSAVVEREPEFEMTSLRGFLTSSQIPVHAQLLHP